MAASAPEETKRETIMKALGIEAGAGLRSQDRAHADRTLVSSESAASSNVRRWRTLSENLAPLLQDLETLNHKQNHAVVGLWPERRRRIDAKRAATGRVADSIKVFNQALERAERFNNAVDKASPFL